MHEVEEEQPGETVRCGPRQWLHDGAAGIIPDHLSLGGLAAATGPGRFHN
jgi:hypothetical protein